MSSEIGLTVGAMELGLLIASVLYGVTTVQVYIYHKSSAHDPLFVRSLIAVLWTLETVHTAFSWIFLYRITVTYYGDPLILPYSHWSIDTSAIFDGLIGTIVQSYSAYRIYIISGSLAIPMVSWIGSALRLAGSIATFTLGTLVANFQEFGDCYQGVAITTHVLAVCVDTLNAAAMSYLLWKEKATIKRTNMLIDKLILWTMETGTVTSITATLMLVLMCTYGLPFPCSTRKSIPTRYSPHSTVELRSTKNFTRALKTTTSRSGILMCGLASKTVKITKRAYSQAERPLFTLHPSSNQTRTLDENWDRVHVFRSVRCLKSSYRTFFLLI